MKNQVVRKFCVIAGTLLSIFIMAEAYGTSQEETKNFAQKIDVTRKQIQQNQQFPVNLSEYNQVFQEVLKHKNIFTRKLVADVESLAPILSELSVMRKEILRQKSPSMAMIERINIKLSNLNHSRVNQVYAEIIKELDAKLGKVSPPLKLTDYAKKIKDVRKRIDTGKGLPANLQDYAFVFTEFKQYNAFFPQKLQTKAFIIEDILAELAFLQQEQNKRQQNAEITELLQAKIFFLDVNKINDVYNELMRSLDSNCQQ